MKVKIGKYPKVGEQHISVHIDNWDTWSMDHTLAHIILPMLKQLKETTHGAPDVDMMDVPKELRLSMTEIASYEETGDTDDNHFKRWDWILDEMIFSFQSKVDDNWEEDLFFQERISLGFSMFGKYYQNLWD